MVRQHHPLSGRESEKTLGDREGQESLLCCNPQIVHCDTPALEQVTLRPGSSLLVGQPVILFPHPTLHWTLAQA